MLFANFVNSVSSSTLNELRILMTTEYEVSQTMGSDDSVSGDIRRWMRGWREWRQNCRLSKESKRIDFRTIRLEWRTIRLEWKSDRMRLSRLSERLMDGNWDWRLFAGMTFSEWVSISKQRTWTLMKDNEW